MLLNTHRWGDEGTDWVVCVHGLTQDGGVFDGLARSLAARGRSAVAVDLRGHGESGFEPPWNQETHVADLIETIEALGVESATWIGHSFGGRLAAAAVADRAHPGDRLVLLEPGLGITPARALRSAETERLDWSFATIEGAVQAILSSPSTVAAPRDVVVDYVKGDVRKGPDGRYRFRFSPAAAVVAWSEMTLPSPPIARCPTLVVWAGTSEVDPQLRARYEEELGGLLTLAEVPNGHNLLWEAPRQTLEAIERFLGSTA